MLTYFLYCASVSANYLHISSANGTLSRSLIVWAVHIDVVINHTLRKRCCTYCKHRKKVDQYHYITL